ncbi:type II secretion system major pseudopilin GspG [Sulfuriroseicoccus oceanibius]|uniref:Type II secretion system major pseudopilin GspG n=1 Tax=Sulfuriroseicoccus oceanibius TaxID=2707525 RepID=A0A6B3LEC4_9BACT|nr:type II secretion system major pseudopilin GspG [Sulfuriroseicoccus oceanibius]QQL44818.1 type II secretion system major pseudopilin GspG [Sulfuriroseicoccus oceanibius]
MMKPTQPMNRRRLRSMRGFTLMEILLVVAIIGILIGAGIYKMGGAKDTAKVEAARMAINKLNADLLTYEINTGGYLPSTEQGLDALVTKPSGVKRWKQVLKEVPLDPWKNPYQYRRQGRSDSSTYEIFSWGPDAKEGGDDDISSQDSL